MLWYFPLEEVEPNFPPLRLATCFGQREWSESDGTQPLRLGHKGHSGFLLTPSEGSHLSHQEDTSADLWRDSQGKEQPSRNWDLLPTALWVSHLGSSASRPRQAFGWLSARLNCNIMRDCVMHSSSAVPELLAQKTEDNECLLFLSH